MKAIGITKGGSVIVEMFAGELRAAREFVAVLGELAAMVPVEDIPAQAAPPKRKHTATGQTSRDKVCRKCHKPFRDEARTNCSKECPACRGKPPCATTSTPKAAVAPTGKIDRLAAIREADARARAKLDLVDPNED